jgi:hypothetical protein
MHAMLQANPNGTIGTVTGAFDPPLTRDRLRLVDGRLGRSLAPSAGAADVPARAALVSVGVVPVLLVALAAFGVAGMRALTMTVLMPLVALTMVVARRDRPARQLLLPALAVGVAATAVYDLFRFGFLFFELMPSDPIPNIGESLQLSPSWVFGYLWRYVGDGGGLALAFLALGLRSVRAGVVFGLAVAGGLLLTLAISPFGQEMLFRLNATTLVMAIGGHVIYGGIVGALAARVTA